MFDTGFLWFAVIRAVALTLIIGGGIIWCLQKAKEKDHLSSNFWIKLQFIVLVCTMLIAGWKAVGVIYPSSDEVQWQSQQEIRYGF